MILIISILILLIVLNLNNKDNSRTHTRSSIETFKNKSKTPTIESQTEQKVENKSTGERLINVDEIQHGRVPAKWHRISKRATTEFSLRLPLTVDEPPKNTSVTTMKELYYLKKLTNKLSNDKIAKAKLFRRNRNTLIEFLKYAGENGLLHSPKHLKSAYRDTLTLCTNLKLLYKRARPSKLACINNIRLHTICNPNTPSYPCFPTMVSKVLAELLIHNNPDHKDNLDKLAKIVELSRLYGGLNYPSDNEAALSVAKTIIKHTKRLEIIKK